MLSFLKEYEGALDFADEAIVLLRCRQNQTTKRSYLRTIANAFNRKE
jgi:hypothetical protein